jgi:uncharacterized protein YukE
VTIFGDALYREQVTRAAADRSESLADMTGFTVAPDQLDQSASVFHSEAEFARNVLTTFKAQIQILQDMYQAVPPDIWEKLMTDLDIYTAEYHDALAGIASGLRKNYVNYADIEAANSKLISIDGYTPVNDFYLGARPGIHTTTMFYSACAAPDAPQSGAVWPGSGSVKSAASALAPAQQGGAVPVSDPAGTPAVHVADVVVAAMPGGASGAPPQVDAWINQAIGILQTSGVPASQLNPSDLWLIIQHESGGDPSAVNNWDYNAAAGTPSIGLMQTIAPTFNAYALPGHNDITNPVDNIIAGTRYALARYGSLDNVPGVVAVHNGQPYVGY